jgi:hypothetical protein
MEGRERRVESEEAIEIDHRVAGNVYRRPHHIVGVFLVGDDDIEAVGSSP